MGKGKGGGGGRKTFPLGRDAGTGQFITVGQARRRPARTTVEQIPKRGHGDTGRGKGRSRKK